MFDGIQLFAGGLATVLLGIATGAAWITTVTAPNCSYDRLDAGRADGHIRQLLKAASRTIALVLVAATALAVLAGSIGAAVLAGIAIFGFASNQWTLAPRGKSPPGARARRKSQRVVAVSLSLMFTLVTAVAALLSVFGI